MDDLAIGKDTKRGDSVSAGAYGEGLKIAALIMVRNWIPIRIRSRSAHWNFELHNNRLSCQISHQNDSKIAAEKLHFRKQTSGGKLRSELVSYSYKDVTVQLCNPESIGDRARISAERFRKWTTVSLDLRSPDPDKIIRTPHGGLIIDQRFKGQIYLKELRVESDGLGGKSFKFGYNFVTGMFNRERERWTSDDEDAEALAKIWETAVADGHGNLVQRYIELFSEDCAEVVSAEKVSRILAHRIWTWLRTSQPGAFYYSEASDSMYDGVDQVRRSWYKSKLQAEC